TPGGCSSTSKVRGRTRSAVSGSTPSWAASDTPRRIPPHGIPNICCGAGPGPVQSPHTQEPPRSRSVRMPTVIPCPKCAVGLHLADENRGKTAKCPSCGTVFTPTTPPPSEPVVLPVAGTSSRPSSWRLPFLLGIAAGGALLVGCCGISVGLFVLQLMPSLEVAKEKIARAKLSSLTQAVEMYQVNNDKYPARLDELAK